MSKSNKKLCAEKRTKAKTRIQRKARRLQEAILKVKNTSKDDALPNNSKGVELAKRIKIVCFNTDNPKQHCFKKGLNFGATEPEVQNMEQLTYNDDADANALKADATGLSSNKQEESKCLILKLLGDKSKASELTAVCYDDDANLLQDLDLAVLGSSAEDYKAYTELLRREYATVSDENYKQMRLRVLQTLLTIPNIYSTREFQSKYEATARLNIENEIITLKR